MDNSAYSHWSTAEESKPIPTDQQIDPSFQQADYTAEAVAVAQSVHDPTHQMMPPVDQPMNQRNRRPLSQSKRAQQNRAAQRAFRQRKELYIKDLEAKVQELKNVRETMEALRAENQELRDYILALQSRWINQPGGVPTPPAVYARQRGDEIGEYDDKPDEHK